MKSKGELPFSQAASETGSSSLDCHPLLLPRILPPPLLLLLHVCQEVAQATRHRLAGRDDVAGGVPHHKPL